MPGFLDSQFHDAASALIYALAGSRTEPGHPELRAPYNDLTRFVLEQHSRMPDYLRGPMLAATLGFDLLGCVRTGHRFHHLSAGARLQQIEAWKNSKVGF